jgi:diacylglycerol kinase family enzyme
MDLVPVEGVVFGDGLLSWKTTADSSVGNAKQGELVFVLRSADLDKTQFGFIICCLTEDASNPASPYRPSFLASHTLPDQLPQDLIVSSLPAHFSTVPVDVIVSVNSGTKLALPFWETVLQPLLSLSREILRAPTSTHETAGALIDVGEPHVVVTQSVHSVRQYAEALAAPENRVDDSTKEASLGPRTILLLSGDGGVVDLLNGRDEGADKPSRTGGPPPIIALMPLGTGNALFHSLHKPIAATATDVSPLVLALRTLFLGLPAKLPTFRATFSPGSRITSFVNASEDGVQQPKKNETPVDHLQGAIVASYGFHASVVYESDTPEYRVHGAKRFGMVAQDLLRESHPYRAHVDIRRNPSASSKTTDSAAAEAEISQLERLPRESHGYVLATLVSNLEQTFCISPASQPLDGQLRLVHFAPIGGERIMAAMMAAYDGGKHIGMKWDEDGEEVGYEQVEEVRVTVLEEEERWRKVCVDGTIVEIPRGGYMSVTRGVESDSGFQVLVDPRVVGA